MRVQPAWPPFIMVRAGFVDAAQDCWYGSANPESPLKIIYYHTGHTFNNAQVWTLAFVLVQVWKLEQAG